MFTVHIEYACLQGTLTALRNSLDGLLFSHVMGEYNRPSKRADLELPTLQAGRAWNSTGNASRGPRGGGQ
jgi:hypothetical protein